MTTQEKRKRGQRLEHGSYEYTLIDMQKIVDFIKSYSKENGIAPTLKEIAVGIGRTPEDFGNVHPLVNRLIAEGFLERKGEHTGRSLMVVKKPPRKYFYKP